MTKRKILLALAIAALLLFWLWPRTAMPDMKGMDNLFITLIQNDIIHGVPQQESRQFSFAVDSPTYTELESLLDNTYLHRSLRDLWYDGTFAGSKHTVMLMGGEAMTFSGNTLLINGHLYSTYHSVIDLSAQIADLLAGVPPIEK